MSTSHPEPDAQAPQSPRPQPLSWSSSSLWGEGCGQRPELHESASSTVWQAQPGEGRPQLPDDDEGRRAGSTEPARALSPQPRPGVSATMGSWELCHLQAPGAAAVHRSHSDLVHAPRTWGHGGARRASLSCSALGGSPARRPLLQPGSTSGQGGQPPADPEGAPVSLEDETASRAVGTSDSARTQGVSQAWGPPAGPAPSSRAQSGPKAPGQPAAATGQALPPAALLCGTREVGAGGCRHALPASGILAFPKLVASVSESGLQAQPGVRLHCRLPRGLAGHAHCCGHLWGPSGLAMEPGARTKDVWTMTAASDVGPALASQDAGVQAAPVAACKAVATSPPPEAPLALHVFPEVTLGSSLEEAASPVRDVRWDAEGMTWEVYGAAVDPEVLGVAIQKHLEMQCEQLQREPASEDGLSVGGCRGPLRAVMRSLRRPGCCGCSGAAPE
ncbi:G protein-regulated inducer of neurite outgrowth 2 [Dasypus novemcinctus]|uniref:G protein-regulated inducer of neurite outgrowth 2 n=1 Tax=Dasypus novemcinctus TaxID=9361 RepID=UPI002660339F|nr:G protein-regulated inducer of neurite outgrowth 2 [Dasypus novemcinctus]XP_058155420.1 G protein-regulated inducer of neurite outgrowth 2 [Dasypus novemcinctus]